MKKFILIVMVLFVAIFGSSCDQERYSRKVEGLWNDYDILFVEIVRPTLEIEDADEFMAYFTQESILEKVAKAEEILEEIRRLIDEHDLGNERPNIQMMRELRNLTELQERLKDRAEEEINGIINGIFGYRVRLRRTVERREESIAVYNEFFRDN